VASENGNLEAIEILIQLGASVHSCNKKGDTPLHRAVWMNEPTCAHYLLQCGALVSAKNKQGNTPLHTACTEGSRDCIPLLIRFGADETLINIVSANYNEVIAI
jgi:ankyrin repeat protein